MLRSGAPGHRVGHYGPVCVFLDVDPQDLRRHAMALELASCGLDLGRGYTIEFYAGVIGCPGPEWFPDSFPTAGFKAACEAQGGEYGERHHWSVYTFNASCDYQRACPPPNRSRRTGGRSPNTAPDSRDGRGAALRLARSSAIAGCLQAIEA